MTSHQLQTSFVCGSEGSKVDGDWLFKHRRTKRNFLQYMSWICNKFKMYCCLSSVQTANALHCHLSSRAKLCVITLAQISIAPLAKTKYTRQMFLHPLFHALKYSTSWVSYLNSDLFSSLSVFFFLMYPAHISCNSPKSWYGKKQ